MYVWRIEKLKQSLVQEQVSDTEAMKYLIGFVCVNATPLQFSQPLKDMWEILYFAATLLMIGGGVYYAYQSNGGKAGTQFLCRYISLGWVVSLRWVVFVAPTLAVGWFVADIDEERLSVIWHVAWALAYIGLCWRIGVHVRAVAQQSMKRAFIQAESVE
jgi:hypothetical protein